MLAVDTYRIVTTMVLAFVLFMLSQGLIDPEKLKILFNVFFLGSVIVFLFHLVKISESRSSDNCMMRKLDSEDWKNELIKVFPDAECRLEAGEVSPFDEMSNPHVMERARSWCRDRLKKRCFNHKNSVKDSMHCLRHGSTDFVYHLQYVYIFDLIGDASRALAFLYLSYVKQTYPTQTMKGVVQQLMRSENKGTKFRL
tara:strand:- start:498 stop:1091 length:594 start_codon:yes stop_codon:yes gene_type:complete